MLNKKNILALGLSSILTACAVEDTGTKIKSFSITGSANESSGIVPINSSINSGEFSVSWQASSSDPYSVGLFISSDQSLSKSTDVKFFGQNCGGLSIYSCNNTGNFSCNFTTENRLSCDLASPNQGTNISSFINEIPMDAFIVIEVCNGLRDDCKESSVAIQLQ